MSTPDPTTVATVAGGGIASGLLGLLAGVPLDNPVLLLIVVLAVVVMALFQLVRSFVNGRTATIAALRVDHDADRVTIAALRTGQELERAAYAEDLRGFEREASARHGEMRKWRQARGIRVPDDAEVREIAHLSDLMHARGLAEPDEKGSLADTPE